MRMNPGLLNAIFQKVAFRGPDMRRYQAAVLYAAIATFPAEIAADDIPAALRPQDTTTAGCVFALLKSDGLRIFERVGRRASRSPGRHCAWINSYRLTSRNLAKTWLNKNGFPAPDAAEPRQPELTLSEI